MKMLFVCVVSFAVGLAAGTYFSQRSENQEKASIVEQALNSLESTRASHAVRAAKAIEFIGSGHKEEAVRSLSVLIADYCTQYEDRVQRNPRRTKALELIDALAKTNMIVAEIIKERTDTAAQSDQHK